MVPVQTSIVFVLVAMATFSACRKRSDVDEGADLAGGSSLPDLVVSGDQPVTGNPDVVVSTDKDGKGTVTVRPPSTWKSLATTATATEDVAFTKTIVVTELSGAKFSIVADKSTCDDQNWNPNVAIDADTGVITGTPRNTSSTSCKLHLMATKGGSSLTGEMTISVTLVNDLPAFTATIDDFVLAEGEAIAGKQVAAADVDVGAVVTYALDLANMTCDNVAWSPALAVNASTGVLTGTPSASAVGSCTVRIRATSGSDVIYAPTFTIVVSDVPMTPVWATTIGNRTIAEDVNLSTLGLAAQATDGDGDIPVYAFDLGNMTCDNGAFSPALAIDANTGALTGTPTNADVGSCTIKIDAVAGGETISQTFTLTITNTNDVLTWDTTFSDFDWTFGNSIGGNFAVASDVDAGAGIVYSLDTANMTCDNVPAQWDVAIGINASTGELTGTPNATGGLPRSCTLRIRAASNGDSIYQSFQLTVVNSSTPPTWSSTIASPQTLAEDTSISTLNLDADATDVDAGQTPTYSFNLAAMTCDNGAFSTPLAINTTTGVITAGTPTNADVGSCTITIRATSAGDTIEQTFTLDVTNTNDVPTWTSTIADFAQAQGVAIAKTAEAHDVDPGATVSYSLDTTNMTCDNESWTVAPAINSSTGALTGTPTFNNRNACTIKIDATSGSDTISQTINVTITDTTAPAAPGSVTNLRYATSVATSPQVTWSASGGADVSHYLVSLGTSAGGTQVANEVNVGNTLTHQFTSQNFTECTRYYPSVKSSDSVPNKSVATLSNNYFVWDDHAPSNPDDLKLQGTPTTTMTPTLSWDAPADNCSEVLTYEVAVGSSAGVYDDVAAWTNVGSVTNKKFTGLSMIVNEDYIMSVRAVDVAGNKSGIVSSAQFLPINLASMIAWLDAADHASLLDENGRNADHPLFTGNVAQWTDVSGWVNPHHFSITGANMPTFVAADHHVQFDGVDDYLTTPNHADINTATVTQRNITAAFRTHATDVTSRQVIYEEGGTARGMNIYIDAGKIYCGFWNTNNDGDGIQAFVPVSTSFTITANTRYFVTWVFNYNNYTGPTGPDGSLECYVNGASIGTGVTTSRLFAHTSAVGLGRPNGGTYFHDGSNNLNTQAFKGRILEFMLFTDAPAAPTVISTHNYLNNKWDPLAQ